MAGPRSSADFYVTFGSNAQTFSEQVPKELAGAREAVAALRADIQALYDDTRGASPSLAQGLIAELQEANRVASKLKTELAGVGTSLTQELDRVLGSLRNMKPIEIKVKGAGAGGRSAAGAVRDEVVAQAQVAEAIPPAAKKTTQRRQAAAKAQDKAQANADQANAELAAANEAAAKKTAAAAKKAAAAAKKTADAAGKGGSANESIAAAANSQVEALELIAKQGQLTSEALQRAATKAKVPLETILSGGLSPSELNKVADSLGIGKVTLKRNAIGFTDAMANLQARVNDRITSMKKQMDEGGRALEQLQELPPTPVATAPSAAAPRPGGKRQQAIAFASGKTADQLLADLEKEKGNAGTLAQALGIGGRGTPQEVARRIAKVYGDMAQQAGEVAVKQAEKVAAAVEHEVGRQIEGLRVLTPGSVNGSNVLKGRTEAQMRKDLGVDKEGAFLPPGEASPKSSAEALNTPLTKIGYAGQLSKLSSRGGVNAAIQALLEAQQTLPIAPAGAATKDLATSVKNEEKAAKKAAKAAKREAKALADLAVAEDQTATVVEQAANYERKLSAQIRDNLGQQTEALKQSLIPTLVAIQETETPAVQKARKRLADAGLKVDLGARGTEPIRRPPMVGRAGATAQELQRLAELPPDDLARVLDTGPHAGPLKDRPLANYREGPAHTLIAEPPSLALEQKAGGALTLAQARQRAALRDVSDAHGALIAAKAAAKLPGGMPGDREASAASAARFTAAQTAFEKAKAHLADMDSQVLSTTKAFVRAQEMLDSELAAGGHGRTPLIPFGASPGFGDDTTNLFGKTGSIIPTPENIRTRTAGLESISGGVASTVASGKLTGKEAEKALKEAQANLKTLGPDMQDVRNAEVAQRQTALEHASRVLIENPDLDIFARPPVPRPRKPRRPGESATQDQRAQYQQDSEEYRTANAQYKSGVAGWRRLTEAVRELDAHMAQEASILDALKNDPAMQSARLGQLVNRLGQQGVEATPAQVESMVHFGAARHAYVSQHEAEIESVPAGFAVGGTATTGPGGRRRVESRVKANERALRSAALNELFGARIGQIATGIDPSKTQFAGRDYALAEILPGSTEKGYSAGAFQRGVAERGRTPNDARVQELRNLIFGVQGGKGRGRGQAGLVGSISKGLGRTHDALLRYGQELRDQGLDPKNPDSLSEEQRTTLQGKIDAYEKAVARYYDQRTKIFDQVEKTFGTPVEPLSKETLQERQAAGKEATKAREQAAHEERLKGVSYPSLDEAINSTAKLRDQRKQAERLIVAANEIEAGGGSFAENARIGDALKLHPTGPSSAERTAAAKRLAPSEHDVGLIGKLHDLDERERQSAYFAEKEGRTYSSPAELVAERKRLSEQIAAEKIRSEQPTFAVGPEEIARARQVAEDRLQTIGKAAVRQQFKSPSGKDSEYGRFPPSAFMGQTFEEMQATYARLAQEPAASLPVPAELEAARTAEQSKQLVAGHAAVVEDVNARREEVAGKTPAQVAASGEPSKAVQSGAFNNECCERIVAGLNLVRDAVIALGEKGLTLRGLSTAAKKGQVVVGEDWYEQGSKNANLLRLEELKGKNDEVSSQERTRLQAQINAAETLANEKAAPRQATRTPQSDEQRLANAQQRLRQKGESTAAVDAAIRDLLPPDIRAQVEAAQKLKTATPRINRLAKAAVDLQEQGVKPQVAEGRISRAAGIRGITVDPDRVKLHAAIEAEIISTQRVAEAKRKVAHDAQVEAEAIRAVTDRERVVAEIQDRLAPATLGWIAELNRLRGEASAVLNGVGGQPGRPVPLGLQSEIRNAQVEVTRGLSSDLAAKDEYQRTVLPSSSRTRLINTVVGADNQVQRNSINTEANAREASARFGSSVLQDAPQFNNRFMQRVFGVEGLGGRTIAASAHAAARFFGYGLVFGITNELHKVFTASLETEAEFVRISDALNATGRSAGNLRSQLQGISSSLATPLEEVYTTASQLTGVFQNTQDVVFATKAVEQLKLISRGSLNAQEAISSLQAVSSAYATTGGAAFQQIVDKATAIQNFTGANVEQLIEGAGGIAPQAQQFHLSQNQSLLYPGLIAQRTNQSGGAAAEQLSRIFESLSSPAGSAFLTRQGLATSQELRKGDFGQILGRLIHERATGTLGNAQITALEQLVGSRQARPLAALIGTTAQAQQTERGSLAADNSAGAGTQRVQQLMQQLNRQFQQLSVNLTNIGASLARSGLLDGLGKAVLLLNKVLQLLGQVSDVTKKIGNIPGLGWAVKELGRLAVLLGTLKLGRVLVGTAYGSVQGFLNRRTPSAEVVRSGPPGTGGAYAEESSAGPVFSHGGLPRGSTLEDVNTERIGTQQGKRGKYGGFYMGDPTDPRSADWVQTYGARSGVVHDFTLHPDARIAEMGDVFPKRTDLDRLTAEERALLRRQGFDAVRGPDTLGRSQVVLLNRDAVQSMSERAVGEPMVTPGGAPGLNLRATQEELRAQAQAELAASGWSRPSLFRHPSAAGFRALSYPTTLGARVLDGPALRIGSGLSNLTTPFDRVNQATDSLGARFTRLGTVMTKAGLSAETMESSMVAMSEGQGLKGFLAGGLGSLMNASLLALPLIFAGQQGKSSQTSAYQNYAESAFPNAFSTPGATSDDRSVRVVAAGQQAIQNVTHAQNSITGRISSALGFVFHGLGGIVSAHQQQLQQTDATALSGNPRDLQIGSFGAPNIDDPAVQARIDKEVNNPASPLRGSLAKRRQEAYDKFYGPTKGSAKLNDAVSASDDIVIAGLKGLENKSKSITHVNADFDARVKAINQDSSLTSAQKTVATADLEQWRSKVQAIFQTMKERAAGIAGINQLTVDQAAAVSSILTTGLGLNDSELQSGLGRQLFHGYGGQINPNSKSGYLLAALYGTSEAVRNPSLIDPNKALSPEQFNRAQNEVVPLSASQLREQRLLHGNDPRTALGRIGIEQSLGGQLLHNIIPVLSNRVNHIDTKGGKDQQTDSQSLKEALQTYNQIQQDIVQGAVQDAEALSRILDASGKVGQGASVLKGQIARLQHRLNGEHHGSNDWIATREALNELQNFQADRAIQPQLDAVNLAAASTLDPQQQAQDQLKAATITLNEKKRQFAAGTGGVSKSDVRQAAIAVAQAQQGIVQQADAVIQAYDSIAVAAARNPTDSIAAQVHAAEDALTHAHGKGAKDNALATLAGLKNQAADNVEQIAESAAALVQARELDPFQKSRDAIAELKREISVARANGDTAKVNQLKAQLVQANRDAATLAASAMEANYNLLIAIAVAGGDTLKAAKLGLKQATHAYNVALKANGGDKNAPDVKNARAARVAAQANIRDTHLQNREDTLSFEYEMGKISLQTYQAQLKQLLRLKDLTRAQRRQIESTLHQLALDNQGQWNFGDIKLPTPYEVRRLVAAGGRPGRYQGSFNGGIGSSDVSAHSAASTHIVHNNTTHIKINGADVGMVRKVLTDLLGPQAISRQTTRTRKVG